MILLELKCIINSPLLHAEGRFVVQTAPQPASGYVTAQKCTLYTRVCFQYNRVKGVVGSLLISQTYLSTSSSTRKCYFAAHQKQILDLVRTEGFEANTAAGCHCHMLLITHTTTWHQLRSSSFLQSGQDFIFSISKKYTMSGKTS